MLGRVRVRSPAPVWRWRGGAGGGVGPVVQGQGEAASPKTGTGVGTWCSAPRGLPSRLSSIKYTVHPDVDKPLDFEPSFEQYIPSVRVAIVKAPRCSVLMFPLI